MGTEQTVSTDVCIAGGGPAGLVLALLLGRAGLRVVVLEKHGDFLRDFRGDTIHPTTLDLLDDLGLLERLRAIPHSEVTTLDGVLNGVRFRVGDFTRVGRAGQLWFMPQWDLLDTLAQACREVGVHVLMETEAVDVRRDGDRVAGVVAENDGGRLVIDADLVVAADGRDSRIRAAAGLRLVADSVPVDVLWFRVPRPSENPPDTIGYIDRDTVITIPRTDYYQCALLIGKGRFAVLRSEGLEAFRRRVTDVVPFLRSTIEQVHDWDAVKLLDVQIAHAPSWHRPGLMLIGDSAHPMSPAFGVGINYAIQDAVATARVLVRAHRDPGIGSMLDSELRRVQRRRAPAVRAMQLLQGLVHRTAGRPDAGRRLPPARVLRVVTPLASRVLRHRLGRLVGAGFRPERIDF